MPRREQIKLIMDEHQEVMLADCDATSEEMKSIKDELDALANAEFYDENAVREALYRKFEINTEKHDRVRQKLHHQILWEVLRCMTSGTPWLRQKQLNAEAFGRGGRQARKHSLISAWVEPEIDSNQRNQLLRS